MRDKLWLMDWEDCSQEIFESLADAVTVARKTILEDRSIDDDYREECLEELDANLNSASYNGFFVDNWMYCYPVNFHKRGEKNVQRASYPND